MDLRIKTNCLSKISAPSRQWTALTSRSPQARCLASWDPNGAGKTTTIKMLLGLTRPSAGAIELLGQPATSGQAQHPGGLPARRAQFLQLDAGRRIPDLRRSVVFHSPRELKKRVAEMLELTGLRGVTTKIGGYSRGMKQRLGPAQALINEPELVFLDEPTSALDPIGRKEVLRPSASFPNAALFSSPLTFSQTWRGSVTGWAYCARAGSSWTNPWRNCISASDSKCCGWK